MKRSNSKYLKLAVILFLASCTGAFAYISAAESAVVAIVDDFDNADSATNFLGLETGAGNFDTGDISTGYDVYGENDGNTLNTAHQLSWNASLGTPAVEDAYWYSFVRDESGTVLPIGDYSHLRLKMQAGYPVGPGGPPIEKRDIIGIDLQVNYPEGAYPDTNGLDQEGKPFRVYRAYQPVLNIEELDLVSVGLYDFFDEYNPSARFTDNLADNIANLRAVAVVMTDYTDTYLNSLNLDNFGTIFIEDVGFWNRTAATTNTLMIDDFEDAAPLTNLLEYTTGGINTASDVDEEFGVNNHSHKIVWNGQNQEWRSDVSNGGTQSMDISSYTHLAYDAIAQEADMGDLYEIVLIVDVAAEEDAVYSYGKAAGSERIQEEYIPLNRFRYKGGAFDNTLITVSHLEAVKEIRFIFGSTNSRITQGLAPLGDDYNGTMWIDNLRLVTLASGPLYNTPPLVSTIDGQDVSYDFAFWPSPHRKFYGKTVLAGQPVTFNVVAGDANANLSALTLTLPTNPTIPTGNTITWTPIVNGSSASGTLTWTPQLADVGTHRLIFTAVDDKGAKDIQQFDIIVYDPTPPVASFTATPTSGLIPLTVQFTSTSTGSINSYLWTFTDDRGGLVGYNNRENPVLTIDEHRWVRVTLTVGGPAGTDSTEFGDPYSLINAEQSEINGVVTNATYSNPLQGIEVQLWHNPYPYDGYVLYGTANTTADGRYVFNNIPSTVHTYGGGGPITNVWPTYYKVKIAGQGWFNPYEGNEIQFYDGTTWSDQIQVNNVALIEKENYIKGKVSNAVTGVPLVGVTVTIKPMAYGYGTQDYTDTTDENGDYKVNDLIGHVQSSGGTVTWISYTVHVSVDGYEDFISEEAVYSETECQFVRDAALIPLEQDPPVLTVTTPAKYTSATEGTILPIEGTVTDASAVQVFVRVGTDPWTEVPVTSGAFSTTLELIGLPANGELLTIEVKAEDAAHNTTIVPRYIVNGYLHLIELPRYYSKGENLLALSSIAVAQDIIDLTRPDPDSAFPMENDIYNYAHAMNLPANQGIAELDVKGMDAALEHYDIYAQGYNYGIEAFTDMNNYLKEIVHWMSWPVSKQWGSYAPAGADPLDPAYDQYFADAPYVPVVVPASADIEGYNKWTVINGYAADISPYEYNNQPWKYAYNTTSVTVYGLFMTDPSVTGEIGRDSYIAASQITDYLKPLASADTYNGKYVMVAEPPDEELNLDVQPAPAVVNQSTEKLVEIAEYANNEELGSLEKHLIDSTLVVDLKKKNSAASFSTTADLSALFTGNVGSDASSISWDEIIPAPLLLNADFKEAVQGSVAREFVKVLRKDTGESYYIIPFDKLTQGQFASYAAIAVDAVDGHFLEGSYVKEATRYIQITKEEAIAKVIGLNPALEGQEINAQLVWERGGLTASPFYPYWEVTAEGKKYYVAEK